MTGDTGAHLRTVYLDIPGGGDGRSASVLTAALSASIGDQSALPKQIIDTDLEGFNVNVAGVRTSQIGRVANSVVEVFGFYIPAGQESIFNTAPADQPVCHAAAEVETLTSGETPTNVEALLCTHPPPAVP